MSVPGSPAFLGNSRPSGPVEWAWPSRRAGGSINIQLASIGRIPSPCKFCKERGDIWGFKTPSGGRIAAFRSGRIWYLTHGFIKKKDRWPSELERAERIRWEQLQRNRKGRTEMR